jgi:putative PIN family toxin of toxin-antitoxin system
MKVVLDTNLLISAFITKNGEPAQILKLLQAKSFSLLLSEEVLTELERVMQYPKLRKLYAYTDAQVERFLKGLKRVALWTEVSDTIAVVRDDESDNRFIELAVAGKARYIITGDKKHLLKVRRYHSIEIVSSAEFLALIKAQRA